MIALATIQSSIDAYIDRVLSGEAVASRAVIGACRRHRADIAKIADPDWPYIFNARRASACCQFFPLVLRHSIGEWSGLPFELSDWQQFCIWSLFGWQQKADSLRRFRRAYISVARKNGKSTLVAGIGLLCLHLDAEDGAQVFVGATKKEQAGIIHGEAERMTRSSEHLAAITKIFRNNLTVESTHSFMRPLSSDKPYDGLNPHCILLDELHAWTEQHRKFYETITSGSAARRQPLFVNCTTAGDDNSHIWREEYEHACRVANGEIQDDRLFAYVAELDEKDDVFDDALWEKANPNLGISVKLEYLRQQAAEAKAKPTYRNAFVRYHCNRKVSSVEHCFSAEAWAGLRAELSDWTTADAVGVGIDLGGRDDLAAWGACARFKIGEDGDGKAIYRYEIDAKSYIVPTTKRDLAKSPWQRWLWDGALHQREHVIDAIREDVIAFSAQYAADGVAFDPHNARQLGDELTKAGLNAVAMGQNTGQFNEPLRELINAASEGRLRHSGNAVLAWAAVNMSIKKDSRDEWMPDKGKSRDKIDPMVGAIMAFRMAYFARPRPTGSLFVRL